MEFKREDLGRVVFFLRVVAIPEIERCTMDGREVTLLRTAE